MFPAVSATTTEVNEDLEAFAARFKARRLELGLTQACVGAALGSVCGTAVSQITICRCIGIIIIIIIIHHYHHHPSLLSSAGSRTSSSASSTWQN